MSSDNSGKSLSEMLVKDIMAKAIISVDSKATVFQVAKMMEQGGIGAVLVKKDGVTSGIITDRDYAIKIAVDKLSMDTPAEKVASFPLITVSPNDSIKSAADLMSSKKIRKLAVVEDSKVIGIITSSDLVTQLAKS
ncbi:MAG: Signal-transduction protein [Nitrosopumilales archaeon]|nr:MAG: Signal-transduction protein [Nitrosopumilales archaeon]